MTANQVTAILAEYERRWRDRTPANRPGYVLPRSKVPWSETLEIVASVTGRPATIKDRLTLTPALRTTLKALRGEYPNLKW